MIGINKIWKWIIGLIPSLGLLFSYEGLVGSECGLFLIKKKQKKPKLIQQTTKASKKLKKTLKKNYKNLCKIDEFGGLGGHFLRLGGIWGTILEDLEAKRGEERRRWDQRGAKRGSGEAQGRSKELRGTSSVLCWGGRGCPKDLRSLSEGYRRAKDRRGWGSNTPRGWRIFDIFAIN